MGMNSKAEAHVRRAHELLLLGHSPDEKGTDQLAFGSRKRRKKQIYTTPMKTNEQDVNAFYYLHYTKEAVLRRIADLYKMFKQFEVPLPDL